MRRAANTAAARIGAESALPVPAKSQAVPWPGETLVKGMPTVQLTSSKPARALSGAMAWSWYMHTRPESLPEACIRQAASAGSGPWTRTPALTASARTQDTALLGP